MFRNYLRLSIIRMIVIMLATAGCAVGPDYVAPKIDMPATYNNSHLLEVNATANRSSLTEWWETFNDPLLSALVARAIANNLDLKTAWLRVREAGLRRGVGEADFWPSIAADGSGSTNQSSESSGGGGVRESYSTGLSASWEIDLFGGTRRSIEALQGEFEATQENLHDVLVSLVAETASNYVQLRTYQKRLASAEDNLKIQTETLQLVSFQYETGLTDALDLERAKYNLESTRSQVPSLQAQIDEAKNRLAILLGGWPGDLSVELAVPSPIPVGDPRITLGIPADLLRRRPDIRQAERELAAQTARIGEAEAELYPKLKLNGSIGYDALVLNGLISPANFVTSFAEGITWSLFQAGAVRNNIKIQNVLQEQALLSYESVIKTAVEEVENALIALVKENERREMLAKAEQSAELAVKMALHKYESGLEDFQSVLDTQQSLASFQDKLADSEGTMTLNFITLYKALGGGWEGG